MQNLNKTFSNEAFISYLYFSFTSGFFLPAKWPDRHTSTLVAPWDDPNIQSGRIIEFFGNSITAGYADEDYSGKDNSDSIYTNNYLACGALTARHYNADYYCTARGGIGIMVSWFPLIMPELFNRLDPEDPGSIWNFSKVQPNVVIINLFQNDSWLVNRPEYPEFKHRFNTPPQPRNRSYRLIILLC